MERNSQNWGPKQNHEIEGITNFEIMKYGNPLYEWRNQHKSGIYLYYFMCLWLPSWKFGSCEFFLDSKQLESSLSVKEQYIVLLIRSLQKYAVLLPKLMSLISTPSQNLITHFTLFWTGLILSMSRFEMSANVKCVLKTLWVKEWMKGRGQEW